MNSGQVFTFKCHPICGGKAEGEALISGDDICFYLADPETGQIVEKHHALEGRSIKDKILVFPCGKGSSIVQFDGLYMLSKKGTGAGGMIIQHAEPVLVTGAIIMKIPLVDRVEEDFYRLVGGGDLIKLDADLGTITLVKAAAGSPK